MTDRDSQLDEIERLALEKRYWFDAIQGMVVKQVLFQPGGLYYEMRRENEQLKTFIENNEQYLPYKFQ